MATITLDGPTTGYVRQVKIGSQTYNFSSRVEYESNLTGKDPITGITRELPNKGTSRVTQLYSPSPNVWVTSAVLGPDGKWKPLKKSESRDLLGNKYYPSSEDTDYVLGESALKGLNSSGTNSLRSLSINDGKVLYKKFTGLSDEQVNSEFDVSSNISPPGKPGTPSLFGPAVPADQTTGTPPQPQESLSPEEIAKIKEENIKSKEGTRTEKEYEDVVYPENLKSDYQDCIKFTIVKYQQSGLAGFNESDAGSRFVDVSKGKPGFGKGKNRTSIATIVLPIPGGIQDSNSVNWSSGSLNPVEQAIGSIAQTALQGGNVNSEVQSQAQNALQEKTALRQGIISKVTEGVLGNNNIMQRQFGSIINPNLELLFNTPELRTFSFSFKLSPRSSSEAVRVKKIIRNFKQAMSVKRSSSSFLLQSPHTFAISYIFKNQSHPYLNRFKECALISCNVNYTPEGNYMAFDNSEHPSMVSYQLDLTFQELEPLYDDEYGNDYNNIGF